MQKFISVRPIFAAIAIAAAFLTMCISGFDFHPLYSPDSAEFSILAKSISSGQGYRDISQPNSPPHTKYPFGYPALLAPAAFLFGASGPAYIIACKTTTAILGALALIGVYFFFKTYLSPVNLLALLLLCASNPVAFLFSTNVMSEIPQTCFSIWSLILIVFLEANISLGAVKESIREAGGTKAIVAAVLLLIFIMALAIAANYYVRGNGIVLLPAAISYIFFRKSKDPLWFRFVKSAALTFFVVLLVLPWVYRDVQLTSTGQTSGQNYVSQIMTPFENPFKQSLTASLLSQRIKTNSLYYYQVLLAHLFPLADANFAGVSPTPAVHKYVHTLSKIIPTLQLFFAIGVIFGIFFHAKKHKADIVLPYLIFFIGLLIIFTYRQHRYLIPLIPFTYYFALTGFSGLTSQIHKKENSSDSSVKLSEPFWKQVCSMAVLMAVPLGVLMFIYLNTAFCLGLVESKSSESELIEVASFLDSSVKKEGVIMAPPHLYLFTNRKSVAFDPKSMSLGAFEATLYHEGISHIATESWMDDLTEFDFLIRSSLNYEFEKIGVIARQVVYKVTEKKEGAIAKEKKPIDYDKMIRRLEGLAPEKRGDVSFNNVLGYYYYEQDNYPKAIECFETVVSNTSESHIAHFNLGAAYLGNGEYEKALREFQLVRNTEFGYTIQHVLNRNIMIARAKQGIEQDPAASGNEVIYLHIASIWLDSGVYRKAVKEIQSAIKINSDWVEPQFLLASSYEAMGENKKAMEVYQTIIVKNPDNSEAKEKLKALKTKKVKKARS